MNCWDHPKGTVTKTSNHMSSMKQDSPQVLPPLFRNMTSNAVAGFDNVEYSCHSNHVYQPANAAATVPSPDSMLDGGVEGAVFQSITIPSEACLPKPSDRQAYDLHRLHSISISMPSSPADFQEQSRRVTFGNAQNQTPQNPFNLNFGKKQLKKTRFHSQPIPAGTAYSEALDQGKKPDSSGQTYRQKTKHYDSFKTWSGKLERQLSRLSGRPTETEAEVQESKNLEVEALPVDRYFDALEGPELETLRPSEELLLPEDKKWPFLLRFPVSSFGICLGVSSQAILWKTLATSPSTEFLHIPLIINVVLWCISLAVMAIVSFIYALKIIFYFEAVRREYYHPIRVNFFFAPWIACLFLVIGVPSLVTKNLHAALWYVLMAPILCLELKIYGQWMSGGQRRLSKVANPSNHLSIVGNFVGALLGASMGLKEGPIFFFAVGMAHYIVLFVTLYQRLPTNETLPKDLHPVFFLFVAAPSVASMAWARIQGEFDYGSRIAYFIALFLYFSLAVRVNFFRGFRFSLAWWAYTFPMTGASIATIRYASVVKNPLTRTLSIILSCISTLTVTALLLSTIAHAFVLRDLFPNDIAIAIAERKPKEHKRRWHLRSASSDATENVSSTQMDVHTF